MKRKSDFLHSHRTMPSTVLNWRQQQLIDVCRRVTYFVAGTVMVELRGIAAALPIEPLARAYMDLYVQTYQTPPPPVHTAHGDDHSVLPPPVLVHNAATLFLDAVADLWNIPPQYVRLWSISVPAHRIDPLYYAIREFLVKYAELHKDTYRAFHHMLQNDDEYGRAFRAKLSRKVAGYMQEQHGDGIAATYPFDHSVDDVTGLPEQLTENLFYPLRVIIKLASHPHTYITLIQQHVWHIVSAVCDTSHFAHNATIFAQTLLMLPREGGGGEHQHADLAPDTIHRLVAARLRELMLQGVLQIEQAMPNIAEFLIRATRSYLVATPHLNLMRIRDATCTSYVEQTVPCAAIPGNCGLLDIFTPESLSHAVCRNPRTYFDWLGFVPFAEFLGKLPVA